MPPRLLPFLNGLGWRRGCLDEGGGHISIFRLLEGVRADWILWWISHILFLRRLWGFLLGIKNKDGLEELKKTKMTGLCLLFVTSSSDNHTFLILKIFFHHDFFLGFSFWASVGVEATAGVLGTSLCCFASSSRWCLEIKKKTKNKKQMKSLKNIFEKLKTEKIMNKIEA